MFLFKVLCDIVLCKLFKFYVLMPKKVFSFKDYVLNTEAHPLRNTWDKGWRGDYMMHGGGDGRAAQ